MNKKSLTIFLTLASLESLCMSCASQRSDAVKESYTNDPVTITAKQKKVSQLIESNDKLDAQQKNKLKEVFSTSFKNSRDLYMRESQLMQQIIENSLKEKKNNKEIASLEFALKDLYKKKYKNIEITVDKIGDIIDIENDRRDFMSQLHPMDVFYLNGGDR